MDGTTELIRIPGVGLVVKTTSRQVAEMLQKNGWALRCRYAVQGRPKEMRLLFLPEKIKITRT